MRSHHRPVVEPVAGALCPIEIVTVGLTEIVDDDRGTNGAGVFEGGCDPVEEAGVSDEHAGPGELEQLSELVPAVAIVDVGRGRPQLEGGEVDLEVLAAVQQVDRDDGPRTHSQRHER